MMYQLLNKLFGWDYIHWKNTADQGVARVHASNGRVWYWRYKSIRCLDVISRPEQVDWLTCSSDRYFNTKK